MMTSSLKVPLPVNQAVQTDVVLKRPKRAYLVMGVPSSGTRLMARMLIAAGCTTDNPDSTPFDHNDFWEGEKPDAEMIVVRRHVAIGRKPYWAKHQNIIQALWAEDYDVVGLVMSRCQMMVEQSMLAAPHVDTLNKARGQVGFCWKAIMESIPSNCPFEVVQYESLVKHPQLYLKLLGDRIGLSFPDSIEEVVDGNHKYWELLRAS